MSALVREALAQLDVEPREPRVRSRVTLARSLLREALDIEQQQADAAEVAAAAAASARRPPAPADYPVAEVRAWARAQGIEVPTRGSHLAAEVVAAWREAQG